MKMWGITNTGLVRSENQDAYAALRWAVTAPPWSATAWAAPTAAALQAASRWSTLKRNCGPVLQEDAGEEQLRQATLYAISLANDAIRRAAAQNADYQHMGTTLVCALAKEDLVMVGNIGDSPGLPHHRRGHPPDLP